MSDRSDAVVVTYRPDGLQPRRDVFEPQDDGMFLRVEEILVGDYYRQVGSEFVADVSIEDRRDD